MTTQNQEVALIQKDITDEVNKSLERLQEGGLVLPPNYNHSNALKSAFFALSNNSGGNLLSVCSKASVANALLDMVTQGLSPAKTQCYFIKYGDVCKLNRSYFGTQAVLKRLSNVKDIWANVIFEGDEFLYEIEDGRDKFVSHGTKFENRDNNILGAYAIIKTNEDELLLTVMTKKEIDTAWSQGKTKNVQDKFPQEMAKRTVINRAAKAFINTSDDSDLLIESINNTTENEYEERKEINPQHEVDENANTEELDIKPDKPIIEMPVENTNSEPEPEPVTVQKQEPAPSQQTVNNGPTW
ncbi:recombinase RecT [Psychrobacillus lasiicapitis]|uniref:Recombinase RecT n=1 Tax=Psychrobacillus lasiicapitis TaxID=1636719 RepID=A0A544TA81_9BACI|nr:RecT family recombinase [Psychrobacillus lasiicapitis]TQR14365.1 recombinase RecT [Psychrobacillus lasiicapitis]GGA31981.1 DNA recombination protein RecT [Psychrobacillus lasiicapitis]